MASASAAGMVLIFSLVSLRWLKVAEGGRDSCVIAALGNWCGNGVFSWVSDDVRDCVLRLRQLWDGGVRGGCGSWGGCDN